MENQHTELQSKVVLDEENWKWKWESPNVYCTCNLWPGRTRRVCVCVFNSAFCTSNRWHTSEPDRSDTSSSLHCNLHGSLQINFNNLTHYKVLFALFPFACSMRSIHLYAERSPRCRSDAKLTARSLPLLLLNFTWIQFLAWLVSEERARGRERVFCQRHTNSLPNRRVGLHRSSTLITRSIQRDTIGTFS